MSDTQTDIDALLTDLVKRSRFGWHTSLTALVAERNALRKRVAELEAQPTSDERARLCAEVSATRTALTQSRRSLRDASESCEELERMIKEGGGA